ncbi:Gfo/Idh/MocA family protein [Stratiformator vulcanicus]|uniref:Putative oxidoreductase YcjS n=1 Tax=Stratiformator vulcanicus TaxID=2527980 RepID=A0A517R1M9_9PLAN|nr:Gfo/Idh/MocA family oxidoreductase [Stratiformator vulcanicus]QDT37761.1 putative oxidoreductase YcjS [Stratiformator vulcanicus]
MDKLKIGVIGLGIGKTHIRGYREHPQAEVVAIADLNANRVEEVGREYNIKRRYTSAEELLGQDDLDIVSICTPNKFHMQQSVTALGRGMHVLCEKPIGMNADEARQMIEASRSCDRRLMINFSYRFNPQAIALKKRVDDGALGGVYFARTVWHRRRGVPGFGGWFGRKSLSGGGALIDLGVHRLDMALWLMDFPEPEWVIANTWDALTAPVAEQIEKTFDVEDFAAATIRFNNGTMLTVEISWAANIEHYELMETRLYGTHGGLVHRNIPDKYEYEAELFFEQDGDQYDQKLSSTPDDVKSSMYYFVESIIENKETPAPAEEALQVQKLLDAIYLSAEKGEPVRVS